MIASLRRLSLSHWIVVGMIAGVLFGWQFPAAAARVGIVSDLFIRLIKCIIVPLLFATLVVGIAGHTDDLKAVGRLALKSIVYFEVVTTFALLLGLAMVNLVQPGAGIQLGAAAQPASPVDSSQLSFTAVLGHVVPQSLADAAARNDVLQVVIFAIIFGVALGRVKGRPRQTMLEFFEGLSEVMFKFTGIIMWAAPFGVAAALAHTIGLNGFSILAGLGKLVGTLYCAQALFVLLVLVPVLLLARIPLVALFKTLREPTLLAFSTASSEAALPDALQRMVKFGVPRRIVSFVMPAGYSFNLDGTALYLSLTALFVAQAGGIHLDFGQQIVLLITLMLTSKGAAGVPRAGLVVLSATVAAFGFPLEGITVVLGVEAFLDMARTSVNLLGNCVASVVIARWEGQFNPAPDI
ncbi:MAG: dicarboxylate/amino acid:cation symporter [Verrucomicrobia bacterium]|nr:MAG: dicarboxylate/amino acid:cation symporter [Verrucomicrobiota bacterium]